MIKVKFVKLENYPSDVEKVKPTWSYSREGDACVDIYAAKMTIIDAGETKIIPTGVKLEIPQGYEMQIRPRSGMSSRGLVAQLGTIDENYRGEIGVILHNNTSENVIIHRGERVAQGAIREVPKVCFELVDESELSETNRGKEGFGSSGQ